MSNALAAIIMSVLIVGMCSAQSGEQDSSIVARIMQEYRAGQYAAAERDCRELAEHDPSNIRAQAYLGESLYMQRKYAESIPPLERARKLEDNGAKLDIDQHYEVIDVLVVAYEIAGDVRDVHRLLDAAIRQDPGDPMNYYNLASVYAVERDKPKMLENLSLAFQHKGASLRSGLIPDPRTNDSFRDYERDPQFVSLMKEIGYR